MRVKGKRQCGGCPTAGGWRGRRMRSVLGGSKVELGLLPAVLWRGRLREEEGR